MDVPDSSNGDLFHEWAQLPNSSSGDKIELALASNTHSDKVELKISRLETNRLLRFFHVGTSMA